MDGVGKAKVHTGGGGDEGFCEVELEGKLSCRRVFGRGWAVSIALPRRTTEANSAQELNTLGFSAPVPLVCEVGM